MTIAVAAFYKFVRIDDPLALREQLFWRLNERGMRGTILLAHEGINGTISGTPADMAGFFSELRSGPHFADLVTKDQTASVHPFKRLKVKVKPEILTFGYPEADPNMRAGTYVAPADWNGLMADPDVVVIDMRNAYEVEMGTFKGAIDPKTRSFSEFPAFVEAELDPSKHTRIAMFCTGGIRCEKASAYLKARGFSEVYHLQGGILNYLAQVSKSESLWEGECFVFDERGGVE